MPDQSSADFRNLASSSFNKGDYERCISWAEQCESAARREGNTERELWAIFEQTIAWANLGNPQQALEAATRLMARARQSQHDLWLLAGTRLFVGRVAAIDLRNRWDEIRPLLLDGLARARHLNDTWEEVAHLMRLGGYAIDMGEWEAGYAWLQEALSAITPSLAGANYFRYMIYSSLSELMEKREAHGEAVRYAELSISTAEQYGNPQFVATARLRLAAAEQARGELGSALTIAEEVLVQAIAREWSDEERWANALLGELRLALGHPAEALPHAQRALELAIEQKLKYEEVEGYLLLGQVQRALGQPDEARTALQRARRLAQERDYEDLFHQAEALLAQLAPPQEP